MNIKYDYKIVRFFLDKNLEFYLFNRSGQALLEFLIVLIFASLVSTKVVGSLSEFMANSFGGLAHVLSLNLSTGVCQQDCFYSGYNNGFKEQ